MKSYDPTRPLIGLHIPKCAGQSLSQILRRWYGWRMHWHYFDERRNQMPRPFHPNLAQRLAGRLASFCPKSRSASPCRPESNGIGMPFYEVIGHKLAKRGMCIYGHFNRERGFGVEQYYPEVAQFFTVVRDPLTIMLSRYFFAKQQGINRIRGGKPAPISARFATVDAFIADCLERPYFINYLPGPMTPDNYLEIFERQFVYVGVAEDLQTSVDQLAARLGFASVTVPHLNRSTYDEMLSPRLQEAFIRSRPLEYALYNYALEHYRDGIPA